MRCGAYRRAQLLEHSPDMFLFGNGNVCEHESPSIPRILGYSLVGCVVLALGARLRRASALRRRSRRPVMMANVHPEDREALAAGAHASEPWSPRSGPRAVPASQGRAT